LSLKTYVWVKVYLGEWSGSRFCRLTLDLIMRRVGGWVGFRARRGILAPVHQPLASYYTHWATFRFKIVWNRRLSLVTSVCVLCWQKDKSLSGP